MGKQECYFGIVENEFSKELFARKSYVELYSAVDAPESVDTIQFSDPVVETAELIRQSTYYNIDYTVEIGYDHEEQYVDEEKYYDTDLKKYLTKQVIKNRTVTAWQPYQGSAENLRGVAVGHFSTGDSINIGDQDEKVSEQYGHYAFDVAQVLKNMEEREATDEETKKMTTPTEKHYREMAYTSASDSSFYGMVHLPGDRQRGFKAKWDAVNMFACVYAVDRYKLAFDFEGHKCFMKQFVTEEIPHIYCSYKHVDDVDQALKDAAENCLNNSEEYQNNMKKGKFLSLGSIALFFISIGLFNVIGFVALLGIIAGIVGFVSAFKFSKKVDAQAKAIREEHQTKRNNHKTEMQNKKMALLEARFATMGWAPLTDVEKARFLLENEHHLTDNFSDYT